jgi:hypothetical protein
MQIILISIISIVSILIIMYKYNNIILQSVMNCVIVGYILALLVTIYMLGSLLYSSIIYNITMLISLVLTTTCILGIRYGLVVLYLSNTRSLYGLINCINHSIRIILLVLICIVTSPTSTTPFGFIITYSPSVITSTSPATKDTGLVLCIAIGYSIIYNIVKILVIRYSIIISMTNILGIRLTLPRYTIILGLYSTLLSGLLGHGHRA